MTDFVVSAGGKQETLMFSNAKDYESLKIKKCT
jgi:hypothetical protein